MESMESVDTGSLEGAAEAAEQEVNGVEQEIAESQEPKQPARKYKVKVDQEELEVDEDELKRGYAHNKAAAKRMEEAAKLRKQYEREAQIAKGFEQWINQVQENPEAVYSLLEQLGIDPDEIAMKRAATKLKYEFMDENERRAYDNERELQRYKRLEQQQLEQQRQIEEQQALANVKQRVENEFIEFFESQQIKPDVDLLERMARSKLAALRQGKTLSVAEAYERAKRYMPANLSDADFDKLTPEQLKKLRQADVNRFKTERRPTQAASTTSKKPVGMSTDDFFAMKDKQFSKR